MHGAPTAVLTLGLAIGAAAKGVWTTPHDKYSSSVGVLGCKINTDRVAYWPDSIDCDNICIKLTYGSRSVHLLRIDQSGGAYDISYDAWNYLQTGKSAAVDPISGGTVAMEYEEVPASECADLIYTPGKKLPLSAANSMNFLASCLEQPNSYVAKNHILYNICDPICTLGHDEECTLDLSVSNQPSCGHTLGLTSVLKTAPVYDVLYQSGKTVVAGTGEEVSPKAKEPTETEPETTPEPTAPVPAPPAATTSTAAATTNTGAIFKEHTTTEVPVVPTEYPATTVSSSTSVYVAPPSSAQQPPTYSTGVPPPPPAPPVSSTGYHGYNTTIPAPTGGSGSGKPSASPSTTFSVVTSSSSTGQTSPSSTSAPPVTAGAVGRAGTSSLAFYAGIVICSVFAAL